MWEQRIAESTKGRGSGKILLSPGGLKFPGPEAWAIPANRARGGKPLLPPDLLALKSSGIGLPYLHAAARLARRYGISGVEVLLRSGIVSRKILEDHRGESTGEDPEQRRAFNENQLLDEAINGLARARPDYSARKTFLPHQLLFLVMTAGVIAASGFLFSNQFLLIMVVLLSLFYTSSILLRISLLAWFDRRVCGRLLTTTTPDAHLPVYSILVPLFHEANQIEDLTTSLARLNWPNEKLDIKLICEQDDEETIQAIERLSLPNMFQLIKVPKAEPRTKPKAMNYALPLCRGEYLVIYDAEDRPSENQLREAYARFDSEDETLACLQAPLAIHNSRQNWLTGLFAIEYYTLFNGILPVLARWNAPLPLGGTSNHFKLAVLREAGGWDSYNVTEDADLGIRLYREGYRSSTLTLPTWEEAPPHLRPWIKQRTRWMKGWMQTILVHNRNPMSLFRELGWANGMIFHLLLTCIIISGLVHPVFFATTVWMLATTDPGTVNFQVAAITGISGFNLVGGYLSYMLLALVVLRTFNLFKLVRLILLMPLYWLIISFACWRALLQLIFIPHKWEKTPHGLVKTTFSH